MKSTTQYTELAVQAERRKAWAEAHYYATMALLTRPPNGGVDTKGVYDASLYQGARITTDIEDMRDADANYSRGYEDGWNGSPLKRGATFTSKPLAKSGTLTVRPDIQRDAREDEAIYQRGVSDTREQVARDIREVLQKGASSEWQDAFGYAAKLAEMGRWAFVDKSGKPYNFE